ncbi:unnamed protein product [Polarella glacialis]|uniref:Uncharacterized protein n=1 Tax=Polarella glacialis TaxID=89957 RepID=A0A813D782_POLGL|nr:unnamed protein product [Polarella glacialis]
MQLGLNGCGRGTVNGSSAAGGIGRAKHPGLGGKRVIRYVQLVSALKDAQGKSSKDKTSRKGSIGISVEDKKDEDDDDDDDDDFFDQKKDYKSMWKSLADLREIPPESKATDNSSTSLVGSRRPSFARPPPTRTTTAPPPPSQGGSSKEEGTASQEGALSEGRTSRSRTTSEGDRPVTDGEASRSRTLAQAKSLSLPALPALIP